MSRSRLRGRFDHAGGQKPLISYARDKRDGRKISLPGESLESDGDWYRELSHKDHLVCPDCDAGVHFVAKSVSKNGSRNFGARAHFSTNPGARHDEKCAIGKEIAARPDVSKKTETAPTGFRLNLNSLGNEQIELGRLRDKFNSPARRTNALGIDRLTPYAVSEVGDLIRFMKTATPGQIAKSVAVWGPHEIPWRYFFAGYDPAHKKNGQHEKFRHLVSWMRERGITAQPVLVNIITSKAYPSHVLKGRHCITSKKIFVAASPATGADKFISPRLYVDTRDTRLDLEFSEPGEFLVLGIARLKKDRRSNDDLLDVSIGDLRQVAKVDLEELRTPQREKILEQRRHAAPGQPPENNPA